MTRPPALAATRAPVSCGLHCILGSGVGSKTRSPRLVRYATIAATKLIMPAAKKAQPRLFTETTTPATGPRARVLGAPFNLVDGHLTCGNALVGDRPTAA